MVVPVTSQWEMSEAETLITISGHKQRCFLILHFMGRGTVEHSNVVLSQMLQDMLYIKLQQH